MAPLMANTDLAVVGTWIGVFVGVVAIAVGSSRFYFRKRVRHLQQSQRSGDQSTNYQAGRDLTVSDPLGEK